MNENNEEEKLRNQVNGVPSAEERLDAMIARTAAIKAAKGEVYYSKALLDSIRGEQVQQQELIRLLSLDRENRELSAGYGADYPAVEYDRGGINVVDIERPWRVDELASAHPQFLRTPSPGTVAKAGETLDEGDENIIRLTQAWREDPLGPDIDPWMLLPPDKMSLDIPIAVFGTVPGSMTAENPQGDYGYIGVRYGEEGSLVSVDELKAAGIINKDANIYPDWDPRSPVYEGEVSKRPEPFGRNIYTDLDVGLLEQVYAASPDKVTGFQLKQMEERLKEIEVDDPADMLIAWSRKHGGAGLQNIKKDIYRQQEARDTGNVLQAITGGNIQLPTPTIPTEVRTVSPVDRIAASRATQEISQAPDQRGPSVPYISFPQGGFGYRVDEIGPDRTGTWGDVWRSDTSKYTDREIDMARIPPPPGVNLVAWENSVARMRAMFPSYDDATIGLMARSDLGLADNPYIGTPERLAIPMVAQQVINERAYADQAQAAEAARIAREGIGPDRTGTWDDVYRSDTSRYPSQDPAVWRAYLGEAGSDAELAEQLGPEVGLTPEQSAAISAGEIPAVGEQLPVGIYGADAEGRRFARPTYEGWSPPSGQTQQRPTEWETTLYGSQPGDVADVVRQLSGTQAARQMELSDFLAATRGDINPYVAASRATRLQPFTTAYALESRPTGWGGRGEAIGSFRDYLGRRGAGLFESNLRDRDYWGGQLAGLLGQEAAAGGAIDPQRAEYMAAMQPEVIRDALTQFYTSGLAAPAERAYRPVVSRALDAYRFRNPAATAAQTVQDVLRGGVTGLPAFAGFA